MPGAVGGLFGGTPDAPDITVPPVQVPEIEQIRDITIPGINVPAIDTTTGSFGISGSAPGFSFADGILTPRNTIFQQANQDTFSRLINQDLPFLRSQVAPLTSQFRKAALAELSGSERRNRSNLIQQAQLRSTRGSGFHADDLSRASAEFGKQRGEVELQAGLLEQDLTSQLIDIERNAIVQQQTEEFRQLGLASDQAKAVATLAIQARELAGRAEISQAQFGTQASIAQASLSEQAQRALATLALQRSTSAASLSTQAQLGTQSNTVQAQLGAEQIRQQEAAGQGALAGSLLGGITGAFGFGGAFGQGGAFGSLLGGGSAAALTSPAITASGGLGGASILAASDRRIKTNIKRVGTTDGGLPIYTFQFKNGGPVQMGVMAQDLDALLPEAVIEIDGIKHVDYAQVQ